MNIKEYVYVSLLTAAAVVMGIIESSLPPFFAFAPGAKVGLANLVMIIAVFTLRWRQVWVMQILRLLITALFTGFSVFLYSFAGGISISHVFDEAIWTKTGFNDWNFDSWWIFS